jgi:hypothetical protein
MYFNTYEAQQIAGERMKDAMREAERDRLIRVARGPRQVREWRLPVASILSSLLTLFMRAQSRRLPQGGREEGL